MAGSDNDKRPGMDISAKESLWKLGCLCSSEIFFSDLVLPPQEVGAIKSRFLVHEKAVKDPV